MLGVSELAVELIEAVTVAVAPGASVPPVVESVSQPALFVADQVSDWPPVLLSV